MITGKKRVLTWTGISAVAALLVACGGGGNPFTSGDGTNSGVAVDFYLSGSTVDFGNPQCGPTFTDNRGEFPIPRSDCGTITVRGGVDIATDLRLTGTLSAPAGSTVVSPVTTVMQALIASGQSRRQAEDIVTTALGLRQDPTITDPFDEPEALAQGLALMQIAFQIATAFTSVPGVTTASVDDVHTIALHHIGRALPAIGIAVFDASFATTVGRAVARDVAPGNPVGDKIAVAIGPTVAEAANLAAFQITAIQLHFEGVRGNQTETLALVTTRSNVDDNIRTITAAANTLASELSRHDLTVIDPADISATINSQVNLRGRVVPPAVFPRGAG